MLISTKVHLLEVKYRLDLLFLLERFGSPTDPALNEPVSVEYVKGPPKILSLFFSGSGFLLYQFQNKKELKAK